MPIALRGPWSQLESHIGPAPLIYDDRSGSGKWSDGELIYGNEKDKQRRRRRNKRPGPGGSLGGASGGGGAGGNIEVSEPKNGCQLISINGAISKSCGDDDKGNDDNNSNGLIPGKKYTAEEIDKVYPPGCEAGLSFSLGWHSVFEDGDFQPQVLGRWDGAWHDWWVPRDDPFYGPWGSVKEWHDLVREHSIGSKEDRFSFSSNAPYDPDARITGCLKPEPTPTGPYPIMRKNDCCKATQQMITEIYKVLDPPKLLKGNNKKGFAIPKEMLMPGAKAGEYDFTKNYPGILTRLFAAINRYGFDSPLVVTVKDTNKAKEGDQKFEIQFNSLGGAIQAMMELLVELKGDSANRLNLQVRQTYLNIRNYRLNAKIWYRLTAILDGLGIPVKPKNIKVPCDFDPFGGKEFKGFDPTKEKGENKLDLNEEDSTESLLPQLLKNGEFNISADKFVQSTQDIRSMFLKMLRKNG